VTSQPLARLVQTFRDNLAADGESDDALLSRLRAGRDPAAAEVIVRRHGPRVLAACRKVLGPAPEAEDAFQATFLVLLRNPAAVRRSASLGAWLYGVAHRIALQARARRARRLDPTADLPAPPELPWSEACAVLHEELDRLPDAVRMPLVLCYLDGLSRDEAAQQLGRSLNSVKKALEKGRELLRRRLTRRGVTLSAGLLTAVAGPASATLPAGLVRETIRRTASPAVTILAKAAVSRLPGMKAGWALLAASVLAVGVALGLPGDQPEETPAKETPSAKSDPLPDVLKYAGVVTAPDGKPVVGAKLWLYLDGSGTAPLRDCGQSGPDGKFAFEIKRSELPARCYYESGRDLWSTGTVLAVAPGRPVGWGHASVEPGYTIPIQFGKSVPIEGTIKNLEGQPVAGVSVRVVGLYVPKAGDLGQFHEDVKNGKLDQSLIYHHLGAFEGDDLRDGALNPLFPPVTTAKDGTFTLKGLGGERIALLRIEGEGIETEDLMVMTRPGESALPVVPKGLGLGGEDRQLARPVTLQGRYAVHGSKFTHTAAPSRPVVGAVTDLDTGKPVPGAVVHLSSIGRERHPLKERIWVKADAEGRYRFTGLPLHDGCELRVEGPSDQPYLAVEVEVPHPAGVRSVTVDMKLKRGIWAHVRVFDKTDNASVSAEVEYFVPTDNPHLKGVPTLRATRSRKQRIDDETIRLAVLPGPGILAVRMQWKHPYISLTSPQAAPTAALPYHFRPQDYLANNRINPSADSKREKVEIGLTRGLDD
jgi:RNA polymerase sigma factor (sigma-70 family)